jgi:hypothetical protein
MSVPTLVLTFLLISISQVKFLPAKKLLVHVENIPGYVEKPLPAIFLLVTGSNSYVAPVEKSSSFSLPFSPYATYVGLY